MIHVTPRTEKLLLIDQLTKAIAHLTERAYAKRRCEKYRFEMYGRLFETRIALIGIRHDTTRLK